MGEVEMEQVILVPEVSLDQVLTLDEVDMPTLDAETSPPEEAMAIDENGLMDDVDDVQENDTNGRIDPADLLKQLSPWLGINGEIKDSSEVSNIKEKMLESTKLVSKCVFTNILRATTDRDVLKAFIAVGGWDLLNDWLQEAKNDTNDAFMTELLKVYGQMPITVSLLKQNSCAKTIKHLKSKAENPALKTLATELVDKWMTAIRQSGDSSNGSGSGSSEKSKKRKTSHKDKESKGESSSSSSKKSSKSSDDKHRDSPEKDATPFLNGSSGAKKSEPSKPRAKTVKTVPTKFRSTGLEQETVLPPSRKKTEKDSKSIPVKRPSLSLPKTPPEKRPRPALPSPLPTTTASSFSPVDKKGGIKLIAPRPKPVQVYESAGFMDALTTNSTGPMRRKRKGSGSGKSNTPTSPPGTKQPSVPSFYQETMENTDEDAAEKERSNSPDGEENEAPGENVEKDVIESEAKDSDNPPLPKKKKKKVSWVEESQLKQYFYFELDETERVNVNRAKDFASSIKQEMMMERQNLESAKRQHGQDTPVEYMAWRRPRPISGLLHTIIPGCNSTEKDKQKEREQGVLQAIFFTRASIPDTPGEPEPEASEHEDAKPIPLEDETGINETVYDSYPAPVETPVPTTATLSLPPEMANFLASMAQQTQQANQHTALPDFQTSPHQAPPPQHSYPSQHGQYPPGMGVQNPGPPGGLMGTAPPNFRGYPPQHHGPSAPHAPHPPMQGMPMPSEEEWGENMHGGPMMPPRGHPPPGMHPRGFRGMGPPRGMPHRGRGPPPGPRPPRVCRHFTSPSGCRFEQDCLFLHPGVNGPPL